MRYNADLYEKTSAQIADRYDAALELHDRRVEEVKQKSPEIGKLTDYISGTSARIAAAITKGSGVSEAIQQIADQNLKAQERLKSLLKEFGYSEDHLDIPYTCKICKDTGSVMGERCQCFNELLKANAVADLNEKSHIQLRDFSEFRLEHYPETPYQGISVRELMRRVLAYCQDYADNFSLSSPSLLLSGGTGLGKTFLSSAIAKELTEKGFSVIFNSVQDLLNNIESEHFGRSDNNTAELTLTADLVILDDLGSEFSTSFSASAVYNIINGRMNYGKPTIVSTNYSAKELNEKYGDRIVSRISSFVPLRFEGKDIRQIITRSGSRSAQKK